MTHYSFSNDIDGNRSVGYSLFLKIIFMTPILCNFMLLNRGSSNGYIKYFSGG